MAKIEMTHVPYKGGGPAAIAVIAGENALMFGGTSVVNHINSKKLVGLAVSVETNNTATNTFVFTDASLLSWISK